MAILTSTVSLPPDFHRGPTYEGFTGPLHTQNGQSSTAPSLQLINSKSSSQHLSNGEAARSVAPGKQRMANGDPAGDFATSTALPPNKISPEQLELIRARTAEYNQVHRSRPLISRTNTDLGPGAGRHAHFVEETRELRHGWEDQYNSSEFLGLLSSVSELDFRVILLMSFPYDQLTLQDRHFTCILPTSDTRPVESLETIHRSSLQKDGARKIGRRLSRQPWCCA